MAPLDDAVIAELAARVLLRPTKGRGV